MYIMFYFHRYCYKLRNRAYVGNKCLSRMALNFGWMNEILVSGLVDQKMYCYCILCMEHWFSNIPWLCWPNECKVTVRLVTLILFCQYGTTVASNISNLIHILKVCIPLTNRKAIIGIASMTDYWLPFSFLF